MVKFKELVNTSILDDEKWVGFFGDSEYINDNGEVVMGYWSFDGINNNIEEDLSNTYDMELSEDELTGQKGYTLLNSKSTICLITLYYNKTKEEDMK